MTRRPRIVRKSDTCYIVNAGAMSWSCANDRAAWRKYNALVAEWLVRYAPTR